MASSRHAEFVGRTVTVTGPIRSRRFTAEFPGWGKTVEREDGTIVGLDPITEGMRGTIVDTESHGNAPYTRIVVRFTDGSHAGGLDPWQGLTYVG